jgi:hypothetical protein
MNIIIGVSTHAVDAAVEEVVEPQALYAYLCNRPLCDASISGDGHQWLITLWPPVNPLDL